MKGLFYGRIQNQLRKSAWQLKKRMDSFVPSSNENKKTESLFRSLSVHL